MSSKPNEWKKIRQGNDLAVKWTILDVKGNPYLLEGKDIRLFLDTETSKGMRGQYSETSSLEITDFRVNANVISFVYLGRRQMNVGVYNLRFIENGGRDGMLTFDLQNAFEIVAHSWLEGQGDTTTIETESVHLTSQVGNGIMALLAAKADKVHDAVNGHIASLDADGNLVDSGHSISEVANTAYEKMIKRDGGFYEIGYSALDYDYARSYFNGDAHASVGGCSVFVKNGVIGRSFDYKYNHDAIFAIRTEAAQGRHAVLGMSGSLSALSEDVVESRANSEAYRILPFYLADGKNDAGLFANVNLVPLRGNGGSEALVEERDSICSIMLVRYILDNFETAQQAYEYLRDYVQIYNPSSLTSQQYETHFFLRDNTISMALEFVDGELKSVATDKMTNFHLYGVTLNADGSVYTNADVSDGHLPTSQGIEADGSGLERWNILNSDIDDVRTILDDVRYSKAYTETDNVWFSEFVGGDITVDTPSDNADLLDRVGYYREQWEHRSKDDGNVWISKHQVIYHENNSISVIVQENDNVHDISFSGVIDEPPFDGRTYGRRNGQWVSLD